MIRSGVTIGKNATIFQGVTIGSNRFAVNNSPAILGDNVILFPGVKIIGHVILGNNVVIGANSVVTKDIPDGAVSAGIPAKILNYNGADYIKYY